MQPHDQDRSAVLNEANLVRWCITDAALLDGRVRHTVISLAAKPRAGQVRGAGAVQWVAREQHGEMLHVKASDNSWALRGGRCATALNSDECRDSFECSRSIYARMRAGVLDVERACDE